jgi:tetratricopeptide (TPR) repeat protein
MKDRFGNRLTCASADAAEAYIEGVDLMLTAWAGAEGCFDRALAADPGFALAHIARARALQLQGRLEEAGTAITLARAQADRLDDRERSHIATLAMAINGDGAGALTALRRHVADWPRDGLILSLTMGVYGLLGFSGAVDHHQQQLELIESLASHWGDDWWFIAYRGWTHAETGNAAFGAPLLERSLVLRPANGNAAHGRAHAFYELGETSAASLFLDGWLPEYAGKGPLYPHLSWHLAMFALRQGDIAKAEALYRETLDTSLGMQPPFFAVVDAGAFNWRCLLRGIERDADTLAAVSTFASERFPQGGIGFANVHIAYAHAAAGDDAALERHLAITADNAALRVHPNAAVVHRICLGVQSYRAENYGHAASQFAAALAELPRIGGSNAQRDGVWETLVSAHLRSGDGERAAERLEERLGLKAIFA